MGAYFIFKAKQGKKCKFVAIFVTIVYNIRRILNKRRHGIMKKFSRIYIEITNVCNLSCSFCVGNSRPNCFMTLERFQHILGEAKPFTDYIYLHVLGEPLLHPQLGAFLEAAAVFDMQVNITTNGTLLRENAAVLLNAPSLRKVSISLHSMEPDSPHFGMEYLKEVAAFVNAAQKRNILCELRMWNLGAEEEGNQEIFQALCGYLGLGADIQEKAMETIAQKGSSTLKKGVFLGKADRFQWPSLQAEESTQPMFCYGLRNQAAILCDGTVVPCCLDSSGDIALGNVFEVSLKEILSRERAMAIYDGFSNREGREALCRRCGYAKRF